MNAPLARLKDGALASRDDRRREYRHVTCHEAVLESLHGATIAVELADLSTYGCSVRGQADWLRPGSFVSVRLGSEPRLEGIVRWVRGDAAGMEFLRPVPADRRDWHDLMAFGFEA